MQTRRSKRIEEKEAIPQNPTPELLRPFDAKNFVRIDQDLLKSLDNFKADKAGKSSTCQPRVEEKPACIPTPVTESPNCRRDSADASQENCSTTPVNTRTPNPSGYSLRTYRKRPSRVYSPEASSPREVKSTKSNTIESEPVKSTPTTGSNAKKIAEQEEITFSRSSPAPSTSSSQALKAKRTPKPKVLSLPTSEARKVRYGWFLQDMDSIPVVKTSEQELNFADPDEYVCFNEKKAWAGEYIMCIGQQNLCKWL